MEVEGEGTQSVEQLAIVERYETVIAYLYPIAQNIGRRHGVAKAMFIEALLGQVKLFVEAGKSNQVARLYMADAGLAHLRFWLRFLQGARVRGMTEHQVATAQALLAEVGRMLGAWIVRRARRGQHG
ncbi:MAG: hypothetical protein BGO36_10790 [Burkholderiales bacterium 68-10]|mgnify:FL=1|jgi:hypothetical protein|nr:MAG: hypothetical protein BGO36_10790 [Burkholderiales bacterium 68-10]